MSVLGSRIKHLRDKNEISQKKLAHALGITNTQLSRYETSDRKPDPDTLKQIADFFEVSTDYLLGRTSLINESKSENTPNGGTAFFGGGDDWTEEEKEIARYAAEAAVEAKRRREQNKKD